jgi:hypothetical protein
MIRNYAIAIIVILLSSCEKSQDNNGSILKLYGDALEDIGYSVARVNDGYLLAGQFTNVSRINNNIIDEKSSVKNMGVIKTDLNGNVIWKNSFGGRQPSVGTKVISLDDGSVICTGYVIDTMSLQKDIFVVKMDAGGTNSVKKIFKAAGNQYGTDIIKTQEGFMILGVTDVIREPITSSTGNAADKKDILLVRINNSLEQVVPPVAVGFPGNDEGVAIKADINGGYIVVGTTDRSEPGQAGNNIFILRINADGSTTQPRIFGSTEDEYAADIEVLSDGYFIAGTVGAEGSDQRGYVWGISSNIYADPIFAHKIEIESSTSTQPSFSIKAICRYKTNSFAMAGQVMIGSSAKMLVLITDANGNMVAGKEKITGGTGTQVAYDVISDSDDYILAVGKNSYENNSMISLLKFRF